MTPDLELTGVYQHVDGHLVLSNLHLTVPAGVFLLIQGDNGAGKSLLIRLMAGLDRPSAGRVRLFGQDPAQLAANEMGSLRRDIGVVFQNGALLASHTVLENLLLPLRDEPGSRASFRRGARMMLAWFELDGLENRLPHTLSLGQRRQVELARALMRRPRLLLWDGLSDGLDPATVRANLDKLRRPAGDPGHDPGQSPAMKLTLIATDRTADPAVAGASRIAVLEHGGLRQGAASS